MKKALYALFLLVLLAGCSDQNEPTIKVGIQGEKGRPLSVAIQDEDALNVELDFDKDETLPVKLNISEGEGLPVEIKLPVDASSLVIAAALIGFVFAGIACFAAIHATRRARRAEEKAASANVTAKAVKIAQQHQQRQLYDFKEQ
ncbi:MAG: lipoprotein [Planctomycetota bacterium]|jgi:hypothetical protein